MPFFLELSNKTNMDIFLVEYFGFGPYGKSHVATQHKDLEFLKSYAACYDYLRTVENIDPRNIIFGGFSLGTGTATWAASHPDFEGSGLMIEGPLDSGFRMVDRSVIFSKLSENFYFFIVERTLLL